MVESKVKIVAIQRGGNNKSNALCRAVASVDYNFDYRGVYGGSKLNRLWLLLKAWITSKEVCKADVYFVEGGLPFWVAYFLKRRYREAKIAIMIAGPTFFYDVNLSFVKKLIFKMRMRLLAKTVDYLFYVSDLVRRDAERWMGNAVGYYSLPHFITDVEKYRRLVFDSSKKNVFFVLKRPDDTGYVKGLDNALAIFRAINARRADVHFFVVGSGTEYLQVDIPNLSCCGFKAFPEFFQEANVLIVPARYEGVPMIAAEAALSGVIPVVATNVGTADRLAEIDKRLVESDYNADNWADIVGYWLDCSNEERDFIYTKACDAWSNLSASNVISQLKEDFARIIEL